MAKKSQNQNERRVNAQKVIADAQNEVAKQEDALLKGVLGAISLDIVETSDLISTLDAKIEEVKAHEEKVRLARRATTAALGVLSRLTEDPTSELSLLITQKTAIEADLKEKKLLHDPAIHGIITDLDRRIGRIKETITSYVIATFDLDPTEAWTLSKSIKENQNGNTIQK